MFFEDDKDRLTLPNMATATSANHILCLCKLCRLCGNFIGTDSFNVIKRVDQAFFTKIGEDRTEVYPPKICMKCYSLMRHVEQQGTTSFNFILTNWPQTCLLESCICFVKKSG